MLILIEILEKTNNKLHRILCGNLANFTLRKTLRKILKFRNFKDFIQFDIHSTFFYYSTKKFLKNQRTMISLLSEIKNKGKTIRFKIFLFFVFFHFNNLERFFPYFHLALWKWNWKKTLGFRSEFATRIARKSFTDLEMAIWKHVIVVVFVRFLLLLNWMVIWFKIITISEQDQWKY